MYILTVNFGSYEDWEIYNLAVSESKEKLEQFTEEFKARMKQWHNQSAELQILKSNWNETYPKEEPFFIPEMKKLPSGMRQSEIPEEIIAQRVQIEELKKEAHRKYVAYSSAKDAAWKIEEDKFFETHDRFEDIICNAPDDACYEIEEIKVV